MEGDSLRTVGALFHRQLGIQFPQQPAFLPINLRKSFHPSQKSLHPNQKSLLLVAGNGREESRPVTL
jgi:hypothetical protein